MGSLSNDERSEMHLRTRIVSALASGLMIVATVVPVIAESVSQGMASEDQKNLPNSTPDLSAAAFGRDRKSVV